MLPIHMSFIEAHFGNLKIPFSVEFFAVPPIYQATSENMSRCDGLCSRGPGK